MLPLVGVSVFSRISVTTQIYSRVEGIDRGGKLTHSDDARLKSQARNSADEGWDKMHGLIIHPSVTPSDP